MKNMRVASVQFQHVPHDKPANLKTIRRFVEAAAKQKVGLIAFPECCISGYWTLRNLSRDELVALSEPVPAGASSRQLLALAKEFRMTIGAGLLERDGEKLYNTWVVAMPTGECRRHRKIHAFESDHISAGSEFTVFDIPGGAHVGVLICYDVNIIENVRMTALMGAEILLAPHQTGGCSSPNPNIMGLVDRKLWDNRAKDPAAIEAELRGPKGTGWLMRWLPSRAHDNGMFLVFSNGIGPDDDEIRTGGSMIIDPYGRILAETTKAGDDMVVADLDASLLEQATGRRWILSRRPDLYKPLAVPTGKEVDTRILRFDKKGI
jgi:predicted amidohydrolase